MKTIPKIVFCSIFLIRTVFNIEPVFAQSALGQLQKISGQKISSTSVPAVSSASSVSNMVSGALVQGLLNSVFSTPTVSKEELAAQQKAAELAAQREAEQQRIIAEKAQSEHDKMMQSYKQLDGAQDLTLKALDNNSMNSKTFDKGNAMPLMRSQAEANADEYFRTHFSPVSSNNELDESDFKYETIPFFTKELLQQEQHLIIVGGGLMVKVVSGGMLSNAVSWGSPILEEGILKPTEDYLMTGKCSTSGKIFENELIASESNINGAIGEKVSEGLGTKVAKAAGLDAAKFAKLGKTTFGIVYDVADTGKELWDNGGKEIWYSINGKTAAEAFQKADQIKNMTY